MKNRSAFGWAELLEGVLLIVLGIVTFTRPDGALTGFVLFYGIMAVIMGIVDILLYVRMERYVGFGPVVSLISGILSVMTGLMLLVYPTAGKLAVTILFPLWFIAHCISRLANLGRIRFFSGNFTYYFTLVLNIIGLVLGMLMLIDPWISLLSIRFIVGFYLTLLGVDCIILAVSGVGTK